MANKRLISAAILSLFAVVAIAQGTIVLAKRTATITVDSSANNYVYTVIADTNWYAMNCRIDIPGYTIGGSDTLVVNYGEKGTTVLLMLRHGTDFDYSIITQEDGERYGTLASANDVTITPGIHRYVVTGTTTIKTIDSASIPNFYELQLMFNTSITVDDSSGTGIGTRKEIEIDGGDFSATANDFLVLVYNSTSGKWVQKSKSAN